jgi:hypothetical protein
LLPADCHAAVCQHTNLLDSLLALLVVLDSLISPHLLCFLVQRIFVTVLCSTNNKQPSAQLLELPSACEWLVMVGQVAASAACSAGCSPPTSVCCPAPVSACDRFAAAWYIQCCTWPHCSQLLRKKNRLSRLLPLLGCGNPWAGRLQACFVIH